MQEVTEYIKAEKIALRLIARAEQSSAGLLRKLEKRGIDTAVADEVISKLAQTNLINDERYSQFWLRSRLRFAKSPRRLFSSLCARGIDHDTAKTALETALDEETENALLSRYTKKIMRKLRGKKGADDFRSLKFLLKNEGFSSGAIEAFFDMETLETGA